MPYIIAGIVIVVVVVLWFISTQRTLVSYDEMTHNALSQIGVQQNSRWDALTTLSDLTKNYSEHEHRVLQDIIAARQPLGSSATPAQIEEQENHITRALSHIMAVGEAYPELKASEVYVNTMNSVNQYENQVRMSRMVYNDSVTKLNRAIRQFPTSVAAGMLGFQQKTYLETDNAKAEMPSMR